MLCTRGFESHPRRIIYNFILFSLQYCLVNFFFDSNFDLTFPLIKIIGTIELFEFQMKIFLNLLHLNRANLRICSATVTNAGAWTNSASNWHRRAVYRTSLISPVFNCVRTAHALVCSAVWAATTVLPSTRRQIVRFASVAIPVTSYNALMDRLIPHFH